MEMDKMHTGELYLPGDEEIMAEQLRCLDRLYTFNATRPTEQDRRQALLREMFAEIGEGCYIEPPFHANWGGWHIHFGKGIYANFNLTAVDDTHIYVGDYTMIGPNVTLATAGHPILPELREQAYQYDAARADRAQLLARRGGDRAAGGVDRRRHGDRRGQRGN